MGFDEGRIILSSENGTYYPGQMLSARLEFDLNKDKKFRGIYADIKGACKVHWTTSHTRRVNDRTEHYTVTHESYEEYMNLTIYLIGSKTGEHTLHPGRHLFPFECQIPPHCPSSFESSDGSVRYKVKVTVDRAFKIDQTKEVAFNVDAPLDLNTNPYCKEPIAFQFEQTFCCWCMNSGLAETVVKLPAGGFVPKQLIPIEVACNNSSSVEIDAIIFKLKKTVSIEAECEPDTRSYETEIAVLKKGPVAGNTTRNWTVEMEVPDMDVYNLNTCRFINVDYTFKVSIETSGCHVDEDDSRRIFIGSIPVASLQYPANSNFENVQNTQGVTNYPASPIVNQPLPNYTNGAPYPGVNQPYPGANPPYPGANAPYPVVNPPFPAANPPFPAANPPYPANVPSLGFTIPENPPYPTVTSFPSPTPFPASPKVSVTPYPSGDSNPPYVTSQHVNSSDPTSNSDTPYSTNPPYNPNIGVQQTFPDQKPSNPPYPTSPKMEGNKEYPPQNLGESVSNTKPPYPPSDSPYPPSNSPYPPSNSPYPPSKSPYPPSNSPHPPSNTPYPISNSPYPPSTSPYPSKPAGSGLRTGSMGFIGGSEPSEIRPLIPPTEMPRPASPFASATAPSAPEG